MVANLPYDLTEDKVRYPLELCIPHITCANVSYSSRRSSSTTRPFRPRSLCAPSPAS
jgi:hypothetical protein